MAPTVGVLGAFPPSIPLPFRYHRPKESTPRANSFQRVFLAQPEPRGKTMSPPLLSSPQTPKVSRSAEHHPRTGVWKDIRSPFIRFPPAVPGHVRIQTF